MIKKTKRGFEVLAKTGRSMGIYKTKEHAEAREDQREKFKAASAKRLAKIRKLRK